MTKTTQLQSFQFCCDSKPIQALRLSTAKAHPSFGTGLFDLELTVLFTTFLEKWKHGRAWINAAGTLFFSFISSNARLKFKLKKLGKYYFVLALLSDATDVFSWVPVSPSWWNTGWWVSEQLWEFSGACKHGVSVVVKLIWFSHSCFGSVVIVCLCSVPSSLEEKKKALLVPFLFFAFESRNSKGC